jgi:hypothetical protein
VTTTIELSTEEIAEIKAYTNQSDDVAAVRLAMKEFLRYVRRMQLKSLSGQVMMEDNWQSLESAELKDQNGG